MKTAIFITLLLIKIFSLQSYGQIKQAKEKTKSPKVFTSCTVNAKAVNLPKPEYSKVAQTLKISGEVQISVKINKKGKVVSAKIVSVHPLLLKESLKSARATRFEPVFIGGKPIKATGIMVYNFVR